MIEFALRKKVFSADGPVELRFDGRVEAGELVAVFGESGAGKSTLLRMLAGLTPPDRGFIRAGETFWFHSECGICMPVHRRSIGFVFQDQALFPNLTVHENVAYGAPTGDPEWLEHLLLDTGLDKLANRRPGQLSGGQAQRVALARAAARRPELLLLDEPISALDLSMRLKIQGLILRLHERIGCTTLLVSHDIIEVARLASRILCVSDGRLTSEDSVADLLKGDGELRAAAGRLREELERATADISNRFRNSDP